MLLKTRILLSFLCVFLFSSPAMTQENTAKAIFAGGCFWCMEPPFDAIDGVISVTSGYTAGDTKNPTYEDVSAGVTGHTEAVEIKYDPAKVSYQTLLSVFWKNIDPLDEGGQFCDRGSQYRSGIFYVDDKQKELALVSKEEHEKQLGKKIVSEVTQADIFYSAEDYHQDYYQRNPIRYKYYRFRCGRDQRLEQLWGSKE